MQSAKFKVGFRPFLLLIVISLLGSTGLFAQQQLQGRIVNDQGEGLAGASVRIKDTETGVIANDEGRFTLQIPSPQTVLVITYQGYQTLETAAGSDPVKTFVLTQTTATDLEEVVVIGYQTIKKADLTGAVSVFNPSEMKSTIVTGSVGDALGTLPGVTVRTGGAPGSEGKVEIRGTGTFGSSAPLYVVDGIVSGANRDFNFNDIESIQVLKDASAAAIYGSRAGNGVIIITTKKGREGRMRIDVSSRATAQTLPRYNLTNREQWIKMNDLAFANANRPPANHFDANTDWQDEVFKTGWIQDHNLSFSGGTHDNRYFVSGNYQTNSGATIGSNSERIFLRANMSSSRNFGDRFRFTVGENLGISNYTVDQLNTNPITDVWRMLPTIPVRDPDNPRGGYGYGDGAHDVTFGTNPIAREDFENTTNTNLRIRGNVFSELEFDKALKYRINVGFNLSNDKHLYLRKTGNWTFNQPIDPSSLNKNQAQYRNIVLDNTLEYNRAFGRHDVSAVIGTSFFTSTYEQVWGTKNDVLSTSGGYFTELDAALTNPKTGSYMDNERLFSVFGRVNYSFADKYLLSFTVRRDESSKFNPDFSVGYFPSIAAGWRISQEDFFRVNWINDLKLRANYGILGTSNIGVWDWVSFITVFPQAIFGVDQNIATGMTQIRLANSDLKWEKLSQLNAGFDATILDNRLSISADYFRKETRDVLTPMQILLVTGNNGGDPVVNAATLLNTGAELSLLWRDRIGDFGYSLGVNASYLKNKILELGYGRDEFTQWDTKSRVSHSIGDWFLIKTDGIFKSAEEVQAHKNSHGDLIQPNAQPGDIRYIDFNDDGQITDADRQYVGGSIPKYQLGMNFGFDYKGFDLQLQFSGSFGFKSFNGPRSGYDRFDDNSNYRADYDPWSPDNPNAKDPRPIYDDSRNARGDQDRWLENGGYLRVKQIALGYSFPKSFLGSQIEQIRLYVNAQNLITFTSYTGLDPEFLNTNIWDRSYDPGSFPNPKGLTFGAQITF